MKPCPFCGENKQIVSPCTPSGLVVNCTACGAVGPTADEGDQDEQANDAVRLWDDRAPEMLAHAQREADAMLERVKANRKRRASTTEPQR